MVTSDRSHTLGQIVCSVSMLLSLLICPKRRSSPSVCKIHSPTPPLHSFAFSLTLGKWRTCETFHVPHHFYFYCYNFLLNDDLRIFSVSALNWVSMKRRYQDGLGDRR